MSVKKFVAYYRVSTKRQARSGLGLEAQKAAVTAYVQASGGHLVGEYTEVETGRKSSRPELQQAIGHTRLIKATLLIAKLDRLARNIAFVSTLMESGVDFIATDNPHATPLTIHIMAAIAEAEARAASIRTKDALAAAKRKGRKLGSSRPGHWDGIEHKRGWRKGAKVSAAIRTQRAKDAYSFLMPQIMQFHEQAEAEAARRKEISEEKIAEFKSAKASLPKIKSSGSVSDDDRIAYLSSYYDHELQKAKEFANYPVYETVANNLNELGHTTTTGKPFTATAVWRIIRREQAALAK